MSAQDIDINFVGGCYKGRSIAVDGQECINFYPEIVDNPLGNSKTKLALYPTPGLTLYTNLADAVADFTFTDGNGQTWPSDVVMTREALTFTDSSTYATSWAYKIYATNDSGVTYVLAYSSTDQNPVITVSTATYTGYEFYVELVINGGMSTKKSDTFTINLP